MLVAGRSLSASRVALSSTRMMATCCLTGQAAGYAAALACRELLRLRELSPVMIREGIGND